MTCLECGLEQAVADAGTCPRCAAPLPSAADSSGTFTDWGCAGLRVDSRGITVRRGRRLIPWEEISWFRDGVHAPESGAGRGWGWVLHMVLANGKVEPVLETWTAGRRQAPPELLAAIRSTAAERSIPAVLTGGLVSNAALPDKNAGLYYDPAGEPGLREWTGTEWSPFLQVDPVASGQPGDEDGLARIWSPLSAAELHRQSRAVQREIRGWIAVNGFSAGLPTLPLAVVAALMVPEHLAGSSSPAMAAFLGVFCALPVAIWAISFRRYAPPRRQIAQALTAAAIQASAQDDPPG